MENEVAELQFGLLWEERQQNLRGIIVVSGLPCTYKTRIACNIGNWAKCPVLCIDHFFCPNPKPVSNTHEEEEVKLVQQQNAFTTLCKVAGFHMSKRYRHAHEADPTLVIKSRLNTTFELQQLLQLLTSTNDWLARKIPLLIIESRMTSDFLWKSYFDKVLLYYDYWGPRTWEKIERVRDDYYDPQSQLAPPNWDLYLQQLISSSGRRSHAVVRRLLIDTYADFPFDLDRHDPKRSDLFDAITYLFTTPEQELMNISPNLYTVEFSELQPYVLEKRLRNTLAVIGRSQYLCSSGDCIFEELAHDINGLCGVCEELIESRTESAYACRLCILTLHKSCAERIDFKAVQDLALIYSDLTSYSCLIRSKYYACKSCIENGKSFSTDCGSCTYQTFLKIGVIPTIVNHNFHPHFLSLKVDCDTYYCKACGRYDSFRYSYCCRKCGVYYHLWCTIMPLELLKHKHGGHEHVMKLVSSREHDHQESYWCDVCYEDMDPQEWSYSCHECPYYSSHTLCAGGYEYLKNVQHAKFVQQLQSQLEDVRQSLSELRNKE